MASPSFPLSHIFCHLTPVTCNFSPVTCPLSQVTFHLLPVTSPLSPDIYHLSPVTCHQSPVTCHLSPFTCHLSTITCLMSPVTCHLFSVTWVSWLSKITENFIFHGNFSLEITYKVPKRGYFWQNKILSQKQIILLQKLSVTEARFLYKNPAYGRQSISRPMRIVAPIPQ